MSWWTKLRNGFEVGAAGAAGFIAGGPAGAAAGAGLVLASNKSARQDLGLDNSNEAKRAANEQMKAYKEQTRVTNEAITEARNSKAAEKRRLDEKQIRRLRHNFRPQGFLDNTAGSAVTDKLGG
jgi:uncharacterized protein YpuA (DUF1002 family)